MRLRFFVLAILAGSSVAQVAWAKDPRLTIPRRSQMTPVQRLNREGVDAIRKQQYEKAEALFLKAYLYDPADPFTLNNLGYIAELQGELDRALKFYKLAGEQGSDASIDRSNAKQLEGKPMGYALTTLKDAPMRVNRMNVESIQLLSQNRNYEAEHMLEQALALDPQNSFTLNNLGVAKEAIGEYDEALRYYDQAAMAHSNEPIVVTLNRAWRGKPVSEMAASSAQQLKKRMQNTENDRDRAALMTVRGVSATNRNDWKAAREDFLKAYSLNPQSAFSLNNLGYLSERDGDLETAHFFYGKAQRAEDSNARVGLASQRAAEGKHLEVVAGDSDQKVNGEIDQFRQSRQSETGDVELKHRDGTPVETEPPAQPSPTAAPAPEGPAAPTSEQPAASPAPDQPATPPATPAPQVPPQSH